MNTLILNNNNQSLEIAKNIINLGGLVAFPTETVYGLGGNALNKQSIDKIYKAKGRPSDNPLIVHVCDEEMLKPLVTHIPYKARLLINAFCPGPITLILNKTNIIPDEITNFKSTVGIRIPENELALKFIRTCGVPIAAPSANLSGKPSPTSFYHVKEDLDGIIDAIIHDVDTKFGLESTIVDMSNDTPVLLRPGAITLKMLEKIVGEVQISPYLINNTFIEDNIEPIAPGMKYKHYSPKAPITLFKCNESTFINHVNNLIAKNNDKKIGILFDDRIDKFIKTNYVVTLSLGSNHLDYGKYLFKHLREFDNQNVDIIYSFYFDEDDANLAFMNRLKKAAGFNIIELV